MKSGEAMRIVVAERRAPRMMRGVRIPEAAMAVVRRAVEADPTLTAMGENRVDDEEALGLASKVMDAMRPRVERELARRRAARTLAAASLAPRMLGQAGRMDAIDRGEADPGAEWDTEFVDGLVEEFRRRGEL